MKKLTKILLSLLICFATVISFIGCGQKTSETSNSYANVASNGGIFVKHGGYAYFVNGTAKNDGSSTSGNIEVGAVYKAKLDANGDVALNGDGSLLEVTKVVDSLVGYDNGSIHIFGDYLYYATPNTGKNSKAVVLNYQTCFMRLDLINNVTERLFTTSQNDSTEEIEYAYYRQGEGLYLIVYEKNVKTLTSVKVDTKPTVKVIATDVEGVLFSENFGDVKNVANDSIAEKYVYFTRTALTSGAVRTGVRAYKVLPDASGESLISQGRSVSLLTIREDKLVYSLDKRIYASKITSGTDTLLFTTSLEISEKTYDDVIFIENAGNIGLLCYENQTFKYIEFENGMATEPNTAKNRNIYTYSSSKTIDMLGVSGDYVYYTSSSLIYRIKYKNAGTDLISPEQVTSTTMVDASGNMIAEIVGENIYFFHTVDGVTRLYWTELETRDNSGALKTAVEASKFE